MARKGKAAEKPHDGGLPTKEQILEFLASYKGKAGKREIARQFGITGGARVALKRRLQEMTEEGTLAGTPKALRGTGTLPRVTVLEITARDPDGDLVAKPAAWDTSDGEAPIVLVLTTKRSQRVDLDSLGVGDRVLAEISRLNDSDADGYRYEARPIKKIAADARRLLGIFRAHAKGGGTIEPINRKQLRAWNVVKGDEGHAKDGDLVRFSLAKSGTLCGAACAHR